MSPFGINDPNGRLTLWNSRPTTPASLKTEFAHQSEQLLQDFITRTGSRLEL